MNVRGRLTKLSVGAALAAAVVGVAAAPSMADESDGDSISFSNDGKSFTDHPASIFDGSVRLVPGDRLVGGIWIRNDHSTNVEMAVTPKLSEEDSAMKFKTLGKSSFQLAPQEKTWVALQVELLKDAGNSSANRTEQLQLQVRSSELAADSEAESPTPDQLSDTGFGSWPLFTGLALVIAGMISRTIFGRTNGTNSDDKGSPQ